MGSKKLTFNVDVKDDNDKVHHVVLTTEDDSTISKEFNPRHKVYMPEPKLLYLAEDFKRPEDDTINIERLVDMIVDWGGKVRDWKVQYLTLTDGVKIYVHTHNKYTVVMSSRKTNKLKKLGYELDETGKRLEYKLELESIKKLEEFITKVYTRREKEKKLWQNSDLMK